MKNKKISLITAVIVSSVLVVYSVAITVWFSFEFTQRRELIDMYNSLSSEYEEQADLYDTLEEEYNQLSEEHKVMLGDYADALGSELEDDMDAFPFKAIHEEAIVGKVSDNTMVVVYPYFDGFEERLVENSDLIAIGIGMAEVQKCVIVFVSSETDITGGLIIYNDGTVKSILSETIKVS